MTTKLNRDNSYLVGNQFAKGHRPNRTTFQEGHVPWNKGTKGIMKPNSGSFQNGKPSPTHLPVGFIRKRRNKGDGWRQWIKIAEPNKWIEYAKYIWIKHYGFILKGDVVHHLNGDSLDDEPENLLAIPREDHPMFHSRWGLKQLTPAKIEFYKNRYLKLKPSAIARERLKQEVLPFEVKEKKVEEQLEMLGEK